MYTEKDYESTANALVERIEKLIPNHPEILTMKNVFDLFRIPGFKCDDISPSLFQAQWAVGKARQNYREKNTPPSHILGLAPLQAVIDDPEPKRDFYENLQSGRSGGQT